MSRARHPWWLGAAALLGAWFIRAVAMSWRYRVADAPEYASAVATGERFVYAFWHSGLLPLALSHCDEGIAVLVSQHRDGELITRLIHRLGYVTGRGSSTRGGDQGVREMLGWAEQGRHLAITPDGPRGPAERVKDGLVYLAARTGRRVVPIGLGTRPAWVLRSWDRFRVPRPFARVVVMHGAPIAMDTPVESLSEQSRAECDEHLRAQLEAALGTLTLEARRRAGDTQ